MNGVIKRIPNMITSLRIIGAIAMIFLEPLSLEFYLVYGICGVSDAIDGFLARKFHAETKLGSVLDSVCDLIFYTVMAIKIFPFMMNHLHIIHWIIIIVPTFFHLVAYIVCAFKFKRFSAIHTYANKALGALIFLFPFTFIGNIYLLYSLYICIGGVIALFSSIEINLIHILSKEYNTKNKSVFLLKRNQTNS